MIDTHEELTQITEIHTWFDQWNTKVWYITAFDAEGNQVSESADYHLKSSALAHARGLALETKTVTGTAPTFKVFTRNGHGMGDAA